MPAGLDVWKDDEAVTQFWIRIKETLEVGDVENEEVDCNSFRIFWFRICW